MPRAPGADRGCPVRPTRAEFTRDFECLVSWLADGRQVDDHAVWQGLLDRGVLVRETGPDGWLRVSIGTGPEMAAFRTHSPSVTDKTEAAP